jgi:hypothetical protein
MARFKCVNEDCEKFGEEIVFSKIKWVFNKQTQKLETSPPIMCEMCGDVLEFVKEDKGLCSNFSRFGSMDDKQKKEVLKKRSNMHLKGKQRDEKEHYKKQAIKNYFK